MTPILIPAYRPTATLASLVRTLRELDAHAIIVVDDGSGPEFDELFRTLDGVQLVRHAVNLGFKGDTTASLTTAATVSVPATAASPVGSYTTTASGAVGNLKTTATQPYPR